MHQAGRAGEAPRELAQRPPGPVGLREAEGAEAGLDGFGGEGGVAGERLEQRTEVELLVDRPDGDLMASQLAVEARQRGGGGVVPVAHDPRQASPRLGILGHRMDLLLVVELQAVLHGPQVGVALGEHGGVPGVDVARGRKLLERGQRRRRAQRRVLAAVHELEDLDGELGVADAAPAPLDLPLGQPLAGQGALGPCLHVAHRPQVFGPEGTAPHPPAGSLGEGGADAGIPGDGPGLEEGLELPGLRPPVPVGLVGRERQDEPPGPPLRPEAGVDAEAAPSNLECRQRIRVAHEHHVDVAGVVQLPAAELAHADDRELALHPRKAESAPHGVLRHLCQRGADGAQAVEAEQVPCGDAEVFPALPGHELVGGRRQHGAAAVEVRQDVDGGRVDGEELGQRPARSDDRHHRRRQDGVRLEPGHHSRVVAGQAREGKLRSRWRGRATHHLVEQSRGHACLQTVGHSRPAQTVPQ